MNFMVSDAGNLFWYDADPDERGWGQQCRVTGDVVKALSDLRVGTDCVILLDGVTVMTMRTTERFQAKE